MADLAHHIAAFNRIVDQVETRCLAAEGRVTPTLQEMDEKELAALWRAVQDIRAALTASPAGDDPKALDAAARSSTEAVEQEVEKAARALLRSRGDHEGASDEWWSANLAHHRDMAANFGASYLNGGSMLAGAFRDAHAVLAALAPSLPGKEVGRG